MTISPLNPKLIRELGN